MTFKYAVNGFVSGFDPEKLPFDLQKDYRLRPFDPFLNNPPPPPKRCLIAEGFH